MAIRDSQDVLILEVPATAFGPFDHLHDSQDAVVYEFPFINAMFVYQAAVGSLVGFTPVFPPIAKQPLFQWGLEAVRGDSITVGGVKRSVLNRMITVTTVSFPFVALSDMAQWKAFETYALTGGAFGYRPNASIPNSDNTAFCSAQLLSMDWTPKFEFFQNFSLAMKFLLVQDL